MRFKVKQDGDDHPERIIHVAWRPIIADRAREAAGKIRWTWIVVALALLVGSFGLGTQTGGGCSVPPIGCTPSPTPTPPIPPVPPAPVGMQHAALIYESATDSTTANVWADKEIQDYLTAKLPGKFRLLDQHADISDGPEWIKAAATLPRAGLPSLAVQNSQGQWAAVPWPKTKADALALLKKVGGP